MAAFARRWREDQAGSASKGAFVPLKFALGEAFQFDWSSEYAFVGGLRQRLEVAHTKLCAGRAFWLVAYPTQSHEMLFDAHARAFAAFGGVPQRGTYDNINTCPTPSRSTARWRCQRACPARRWCTCSETATACPANTRTKW